MKVAKLENSERIWDDLRESETGGGSRKDLHLLDSGKAGGRSRKDLHLFGDLRGSERNWEDLGGVRGLEYRV